MLPTLLKVSCLAEQWGVSIVQAHKIAQRLPQGVVIRCGKRMRINKEALEAWYSAGGTREKSNKD